MIELLPLLLINSLYIFGFGYATEYGETVEKKPDPEDKEILWFVRWHLRNAPNYIQKPIFRCVVCMASVHSYPYLILHHELTLLNLATYIIYIFALSGFNKLLNDRVFN